MENIKLICLFVLFIISLPSCSAQKKTIFTHVLEGVEKLNSVNSFEPNILDNERIGSFDFNVLSFPENHKLIKDQPYYLVEKGKSSMIYVEKRGANFRSGGNFWIKGVEGNEYSYFIAGSCQDENCKSKNLNVNGIFFIDVANSGIYFIGLSNFIPGLLKPKLSDVNDIFKLDSDLRPTDRFRVYNGTIVSRSRIDYELFHTKSSESLLKQKDAKECILEELTFLDLEKILSKKTHGYFEVEGLADILPGLPIWFCYPECFFYD